MAALPEEELRGLQRRLAAIFSEAAAAYPAPNGIPKPTSATMALLGMLNWFYMWGRDGGPVGRKE